MPSICEDLNYQINTFCADIWLKLAHRPNTPTSNMCREGAECGLAAGLVMVTLHRPLNSGRLTLLVQCKANKFTLNLTRVLFLSINLCYTAARKFHNYANRITNVTSSPHCQHKIHVKISPFSFQGRSEGEGGAAGSCLLIFSILFNLS